MVQQGECSQQAATPLLFAKRWPIYRLPQKTLLLIIKKVCTTRRRHDNSSMARMQLETAVEAVEAVEAAAALQQRAAPTSRTRRTQKLAPFIRLTARRHPTGNIETFFVGLAISKRSKIFCCAFALTLFFSPLSSTQNFSKSILPPPLILSPFFYYQQTVRARAHNLYFHFIINKQCARAHIISTFIF